jgi:hypothetical protein
MVSPLPVFVHVHFPMGVVLSTVFPWRDLSFIRFSLHFFGLFGPVARFLFILKFDGRYHLCFHAHNSEFL